MARVYQAPPAYIDRDDAVARGSSVASRIVYLIGTVIIGALAIRFLFSLLGANQGNAIANFIYSFSEPFVRPFFGLFSYTPQFGIARFEFETLVAIAFYAILFAIIGRLVGLGRRT